MKFMLFALFAANCLFCARGHAYMSWPPSRNFDKCDFWNPHSLNGHCSNCNTDTCGKFGSIDFAKIHHNPTNAYQAGDLLEVETIATAHHMGYMELRICSRPHDLTQHCFDEHVLLRDDETAEMDPAPVDENHRGRWYIPPLAHPVDGTPVSWPRNPQFKPVENQCSGAARDKARWTTYQWKVRLPADLECDHCVVQFFWVTANSCSPAGFQEYFDDSTTKSWISSKFGGDSDAWWGRSKTSCPSDVGDPRTNGNGAEKFWNCGDIKVTRCTGPHCTTTNPPVATTTATLLATSTKTTTNTLANTDMAIRSGDRIFLKAHTGNHIDVQGSAVAARWNDHGPVQTLIIESGGNNGGAIYSGSSIFLRADMTGSHIDVQGNLVQARWNDQGAAQTMVIEKQGGGAIFPGDAIFLLTHTGNHLDVEAHSVQARWNDRGDWQKLILERPRAIAVRASDTVFLKAHTGDHVDVEGDSVQARWNDHGDLQRFVLEANAAGPITSGDTVFLKSHTGAHVDVEGDVVRARWNDKGVWQSMAVEKHGGGVVHFGDRIFFKAHTDQHLDVQDGAVHARWHDRGQWQGFIVEGIDVTSTTSTTALPSKSKELVAFVENWLPCPSSHQIAGYTKVVISFAVSYVWRPGKNQCDHSCTIGSPVPICDNSPQPGLIQQWQRAGTRVILSFGGAGMGGSWAGDSNDCWEACFDRVDSVVSQLAAIVSSQGFDGVDIDYEYHITRKSAAFLTDMTKKLKASLGPDKTVSHAPMDSDLDSGDLYFNVLKNVASHVDYVLPQYYNGFLHPVAGMLPVLSHYGDIVLEIFGGDASKVIFGFCINACPGFNVDGAQAVQILDALGQEFPNHGGAFLWAASHDVNKAWSAPVAKALSIQ